MEEDRSKYRQLSLYQTRQFWSPAQMIPPAYGPIVTPNTSSISEEWALITNWTAITNLDLPNLRLENAEIVDITR